MKCPGSVVLPVLKAPEEAQGKGAENNDQNKSTNHEIGTMTVSRTKI
jgi:hypothetical protein